MEIPIPGKTVFILRQGPACLGLPAMAHGVFHCHDTTYLNTGYIVFNREAKAFILTGLVWDHWLQIFHGNHFRIWMNTSPCISIDIKLYGSSISKWFTFYQWFISNPPSRWLSNFTLLMSSIIDMHPSDLVISTPCVLAERVRLSRVWARVFPQRQLDCPHTRGPSSCEAGYLPNLCSFILKALPSQETSQHCP